MKIYLKRIFIGLFSTILILGLASAYMITSLQSNAKLINYVGIVRGATQRLVKLELGDEPNDDIIRYLDSILNELIGQEDNYGLPILKDDAYQSNLNELHTMWGELKKDILAYRNKKDDSLTLLNNSERYFDKANKTVFSAEAYTTNQLKSLLILGICLLFAILMVWIVIILTSARKLLGLETANKKLADITMRDPLTGVYMLPYFIEMAQRQLDQHTGGNYAIIYVDFADFKYINDVFGYTYGDNILKMYGSILLEALKENELCGRVSADNFVLMLTYEDKNEVAIRQKKVDQKISEIVLNKYHHDVLTTCCGICCIEDIKEHM